MATVTAPLGIVSGSGLVLDAVFDEIEERRAFSEIPELAALAGDADDALAGHERLFLRGRCGRYPIVLQCGRLHLYEGFDYETVVRTVEVLKGFGVNTVLFTNAAGGLKPGMSPGDLVGVDRVRLWRYNRWSATPGMLFTDFLVSECDFIGAYQWMHGPCYETRAEIAAIQHSGAVAVGMSTAPELMRCQDLGLRAGVISCITNSCCRPQTLTHSQVVAAARQASGKLVALIRRALPTIMEGES